MSANGLRSAIGTAGLVLVIAGMFEAHSGRDFVLAFGCFMCGVASFQIYQRKHRGVPPRRVALRDAQGREKPPPGKAGLR